MSTTEEKLWRDTALILLGVSVALIITEQIYGPVLIWTFQLFVIYLPAVLSLVIYATVKLKNTKRAGSSGPVS
ncbi:MAG TPA: hypothetical protein EYH45_01650 [Candidatus Caldiarchaeum subterraneum]|uniref:Uncharacterized protein n=1 Tax=Caldiarchaeum subterraneum TaxID=311458 RepID=A0A833EA01_CALS0|nr:hypothetical protein [Aigarchaeota archaeon]HIQ29250.1 hypothetical protein [Candidatus Caldarchaeum subterraneum]